MCIEAALLHGRGCDVQLIDFGLAASIKPNEVLTKHVGTPYYIAPEVHR